MKLNQQLIEKAKILLNSKEFANGLSKTSLKEEAEVSSQIFQLHLDNEIKFKKEICSKFVNFVLSELKLNDECNNLKVVLSSDKDRFETFAFYDLNKKIAAVYCENRHILDCFRSLAHELVHFKQDIRNEITNDQVSGDNDGVDIENEANALAGVIMRKFGRDHRELY